MGTFRQIFYHIIFATKHRELTITETHCEELYKYIWGIITNHSCRLYRISGVEDHLHLLIGLHPSVALADLMREVKSRSSLFMKESGRFPEFRAWQEGYSAFTCSVKEKERIIEYIKKQKEHHRKESSMEEFKRLLEENRVDYKEQYLYE